WLILAPLLLENGDLPGYRNHRAAMLARFAATHDQLTAAKTAAAALLVPTEGAELEQGTGLAQQAGNLGQETPFVALTKGLAEFRLGHWENAVEFEAKVLARSDLDDSTTVAANCILAMAQHQLSHLAESRRVLSRADELAQKSRWATDAAHLPEEDWYGALIARVLLREVHGLVDQPRATESRP